MRPQVTPAMIAMLSNAQRGEALNAGLSGRSAMGGATWTRTALLKRGMLTAAGTITDAGRAVVEKQHAEKARRIDRAVKAALSANHHQRPQRPLSP